MFNRLDYRCHFLVNSIDFLVSLVTEAKKQSDTDKTRQKQDDRHQMGLFFHKLMSFLGGYFVFVNIIKKESGKSNCEIMLDNRKKCGTIYVK